MKIDIEHDGVGFPDAVTPWSIASRVRDIGGHLGVVPDRETRAHLSITPPQV